MQTIALTYDNRTVALAGRNRYWLAAHVEALPDGHPTKRVVAFMALFARDILNEQLPGPYTNERALQFARLALADPAVYAAHRRCTDAELAAALRLPVGEIPAVRQDQARRPPTSGRQRGHRASTTARCGPRRGPRA